MTKRAGGVTAAALMAVLGPAKAEPKVTPVPTNPACTEAAAAGFRQVDEAFRRDKPLRQAEYEQAGDKAGYREALMRRDIRTLGPIAFSIDRDMAACPIDPAKGVEALQNDFSILVNSIRQPLVVE